MQKHPKSIKHMSNTCQPIFNNTQTMAEKCPTHIQTISNKCPQSLQQVPETCRTMSAKCPTSVRQISKTCQTHGKHGSNKCPTSVQQISQKSPKHVQQVCQKCVCNLPTHIVWYFLHLIFKELEAVSPLFRLSKPCVLHKNIENIQCFMTFLFFRLCMGLRET
jgi:hypothetical protein